MRQRIGVALDLFIEFAKVSDKSHSTVLLGYNKGWCCLHTVVDFSEHSCCDKLVQIFLEGLFMYVRDRERSGMVRFSAVFEFYLNRQSFELSQLTIKELLVLVKHLEKLPLLRIAEVFHFGYFLWDIRGVIIGV
jgi:hypothetical protein